MPPETSVDFTVRCPGYADFRGHLTDFGAPTVRDGRTIRLCRVELERD